MTAVTARRIASRDGELVAVMETGAVEVEVEVVVEVAVDVAITLKLLSATGAAILLTW